MVSYRIFKLGIDKSLAFIYRFLVSTAQGAHIERYARLKVKFKHHSSSVGHMRRVRNSANIFKYCSAAEQVRVIEINNFIGSLLHSINTKTTIKALFRTWSTAQAESVLVTHKNNKIHFTIYCMKQFFMTSKQSRGFGVPFFRSCADQETKSQCILKAGRTS